MALPRLRQAVVAAVDLDATAAALERHFGVHDPFHDKGVGHFGLRNAVYALGDTFIEIVSPTQDDTAAGRQIARAGGDCGYMCMFELADADATRQRVQAAGARLVHDNSHPDIVDLHLHPKDVPGAIVALDISDPVGSWRWGGPEWTATIPPHGPGGLLGLTVAVHEPETVAGIWSGLLGLSRHGTTITLDGGAQTIEFVPVAPTEVERIVEVRAAAPGRSVPGSGADADIAGVRFRCIDEGRS
jgi:predicted enzyme related to lactoylglutathione lyase